MANFNALLSSLRRVEQQLERQLTGVRTAISSLSFGSAVSPAIPGRGSRVQRSTRKRRKMSAAARAKISAAQKKRWAAHKAGKK